MERFFRRCKEYCRNFIGYQNCSSENNGSLLLLAVFIILLISLLLNPLLLSALALLGLFIWAVFF